MKDKKPVEKRRIIAYRRSCSVKGTGLSHYIMMRKK
ncbi:MAG: modified peptide precursor CbpA [Planctomycetota bacterium]|nr:MAG: modified peptide precursor CbpA [Planctomycetota bacterium]